MTAAARRPRAPGRASRRLAALARPVRRGGPGPGAPAGPPTPAQRSGADRRDGERGASSIELAGMLPLLLLVALAAIQLGVAGYAVQQAGTGARAAARTASHEELAGQCASAGKAAMSGWTAKRATVECGRDDDAATGTATVTIPSVLPGINSLGDATRTVTMPSD